MVLLILMHLIPGFWEKKAELWNSDVDTVKTARCGNCAAFDQTNKIMNCMIKGIMKLWLQILMMFWTELT